MTKKGLWRKAVITVGAFACAACLTLFGNQDAKAAVSVEDLKQTSSSTTSVNVEWKQSLEAQRYYVEISEDQEQWVEEGSTSSSTKWISGLSAGMDYYVRIKAEDKNGEITYSNVIQIVTEPSSSPANFKQTGATTKSITLGWDAVPGANMYEIYSDDNPSSQKELLATTTKTKYTRERLKTSYSGRYYYVYACRKSSEGYVAKGNGVTLYSLVKTVPGKMSKVKNKNWGTSKASSYLNLEWKKVDKADGYQVKIYNAKNKCIETYNTSYGWISVSSLSGKNCVYAKIRSYVAVNGKKMYGAWSDKQWLVPNVYGTKSWKTGLLSVSWRGIKGATGYDIYVKSDYNAVYKKVKSVGAKTRSYKMTKFKGRKINNGTSYYIAIIAKKKVGNKTYKSN